MANRCVARWCTISNVALCTVAVPPGVLLRYFPTLLIVLLAVFNDGAMIALSKDRVVASPTPNSWNLKAIFITGIVYGLYLTISSWALYYTACKIQVSPLSHAALSSSWHALSNLVDLIAGMPTFQMCLHVRACIC